MRNCPYHEYYINQAGSGVGTIYRGASYQKGHGIGSFLGSLFRSIMPLIKGGIHTVGKEILRTGANIIGDINNRIPTKEALKSRISEAGQMLKRKAEDKLERMVGAGYKRKHTAKKFKTNRRSTKSKKKKVKLSSKSKVKTYRDIFS